MLSGDDWRRRRRSLTMTPPREIEGERIIIEYVPGHNGLKLNSPLLKKNLYKTRPRINKSLAFLGKDEV